MKIRLAVWAHKTLAQSIMHEDVRILSARPNFTTGKDTI